MYKKILIPCAMAMFLMVGVSSPAWASNGYLQKAGLHDFLSGADLPGGGLLTRNRHKIHVAIAASGLDQNAAYSAWWIIFNSPEACANGVGACAASDLRVPEVRASLVHATGFVTGNDGTANVTASMRPGRIPENTDVVIGSGLQRRNVFKAEIHFALRTHGPINVGNVVEQIGYFDPECQNGSGCAIQSAVIFPPVVSY
jgi:hypothetical protein